MMFQNYRFVRWKHLFSHILENSISQFCYEHFNSSDVMEGLLLKSPISTTFEMCCVTNLSSSVNAYWKYAFAKAELPEGA